MNVKNYLTIISGILISLQIFASEYTIYFDDEEMVAPLSSVSSPLVKGSPLLGRSEFVERPKLDSDPVKAAEGGLSGGTHWSQPAVPADVELSSKSNSPLAEEEKSGFLSRDTVRQVAVVGTVAVGVGVVTYGVKRTIDFFRSPVNSEHTKSLALNALSHEQRISTLMPTPAWLQDFKNLGFEVQMDMSDEIRQKVWEAYCKRAQPDPFILLQDQAFMNKLGSEARQKFKDILVSFAVEFADHCVAAIVRDDQKDLLIIVRADPEKILENEHFNRFDTEQQQAVRVLFNKMHEYLKLLHSEEM